ncbi:MAG: sugar phosphate nucleotidyltransferase [Anaerolineae bacterium]|jgi:glucose-1-phosphate cytidylyltransferase
MNERSAESLPVVILIGGQGTRMQGDTPTKKELVEVGGRPILWHVMKIFAAYGHTHFILALGYQADTLKRYFLEFEPMTRDFTLLLGDAGEINYHQSNRQDNWQVTLADTGLLTQKASRIRRVACYVDADTFFVTYGDGVGDIDLDALLAFHRSHGRLATLTGARARWQYGIVHTDAEGQISGFEEKPLLDHWINGGFMVFNRGVFDYIGDGDDVHLEREVLPRLASEGQLMMYRHTGFWRSMDTFKEAQILDELWRREKPWKVW